MDTLSVDAVSLWIVDDDVRCWILEADDPRRRLFGVIWLWNSTSKLENVKNWPTVWSWRCSEPLRLRFWWGMTMSYSNLGFQMTLNYSNSRIKIFRWRQTSIWNSELFSRDKTTNDIWKVNEYSDYFEASINEKL